MSAASLPPPITQGQVKLIHVMLTRQGIADDDYREMLESNWGVDTSKKLTRKQANELLTRLGAGRQKPKPKKPARPRRDANVVALATPAQQQLIRDLVREVKWRMQPPGAAYAAWLQNNQSLDKPRTAAEASRVIRGLKALKDHQSKGAPSRRSQ